MSDLDRCPKCGAPTYTWGDPLPGQTTPRPGQHDQRVRRNWKCVACDWRWPEEQEKERAP